MTITLPELEVAPAAILPARIGDRKFNLDLYAVHALLVEAEKAADKWAAFRESFAQLIDAPADKLCENQLRDINDFVILAIHELEGDRKKKVASLVSSLRSMGARRGIITSSAN